MNFTGVIKKEKIGKGESCPSDFLAVILIVYCFRSQDFVYLTVGFKSLSYELQEEKLVYDIYAMFGKLQH